jgi:hypothetical protein
MKAGFDVISGGKSEGKDAVGSKAWSKRVRAQAKELVSSLETHYMDLAEILYAVYDTPIDGDRSKSPVFTSWGFHTFRDYAEQELGLHYKKAESLRGVWYWLEIELDGLDPAIKKRLQALGWTKCRVLRRVVKLSNAKHWVDRAENMNYQTIEAAVKKAIDRQEDEEIERDVRESGDPIEKSNKLAADKTEAELEEDAREEAHTEGENEDNYAYDGEHALYTKNFVFLPDQIETVKLAIKRAAELSNKSSPGHNLSLICLDYIATNDFTKASEEQRLRYIAKLEKLMGYKLIVVDPKTKDIVFGLGTLEKVAKAQD